MTDVLTVRMSSQQKAEVDRRAAELGQERSAYIRCLIEEDIRTAEKPRKHVFASEDLVGAVDTGVKSGTASSFREIIRERIASRHDKNRRHRST
jgi:hypothetical protein